MSENFKIDDEFAEFEAEHQDAAKEAGKAEKMVMGINMPVGTIGKACILSMSGGKSKVKVDPKTKQPTGGNPMVTLTDMVETPSQYAGQKVNSYFTFNATQTQTVQQKYQRFYDAMEDRGMPKELRGQPMAAIAKWCAAEERSFDYEVTPHWSNPQDKEFKPQGVAKPMPTSKDIEAEMGVTYKVGQAVKAAGNPAEIVEVLPDGKYKVRFPSGDMMDIPASAITE